MCICICWVAESLTGLQADNKAQCSSASRGTCAVCLFDHIYREARRFARPFVRYLRKTPAHMAGYPLPAGLTKKEPLQINAGANILVGLT